MHFKLNRFIYYILIFIVIIVKIKIKFFLNDINILL